MLTNTSSLSLYAWLQGDNASETGYDKEFEVKPSKHYLQELLGFHMQSLVQKINLQSQQVVHGSRH